MEIAMAAWGMNPHEVMELTDEQFNSLMCRLNERQERERAANKPGGDREIGDGEALRELGVAVETWPGTNEKGDK
jgi:hypothetical protein